MNPSHLAVAIDLLCDAVDVQHVLVQPPLVLESSELGLVLQSRHLGQQEPLPPVPPEPRHPGAALQSRASSLQRVGDRAESVHATVLPVADVLAGEQEPAASLTNTFTAVTRLGVCLRLHPARV